MKKELNQYIVHKQFCNKYTKAFWDEAEKELNDKGDGLGKIIIQKAIDETRNLCTCGLDAILLQEDDGWVNIKTGELPKLEKKVWLTIQNNHDKRIFVIGDSRICYSHHFLQDKPIGWHCNGEPFAFIFNNHTILAWKYKEEQPAPYIPEEKK